MFILPFGMLAGGAVALTIRSGEAMPLAWVHAAQDADRGLFYRPADDELVLSFKLSGVRYWQPRVIAIGSSRIRYFSSAPFFDARSFYNVYVPSMNLKEMSDFIHSLTPDTAPDTMIIAVDVQRLRQRYPWEQIDPVPGEITVSQVLLRVRRVMQEWITGRLALSDIGGTGGMRPLGLGAIADGVGFLFDGSIYFPETRTAEQTEARLALTREKFAEADPAEATNQRVHPEAVDALRGAIVYLQAMDVEVIGVIMPYTLPSLAEQMIDSPRYVPLFAAHSATVDLFESLDADLFDFFDSRALDMQDADIADGIHSTMHVSRRLYAEMIRGSPSLAALADAACAADASCTRPVQ
jgi:hypothetical protein